ncbi:MAG: hypothetical protein OXT73_08640 [Bacteroidota bacterium]|nr:hypothetical protein [Bacteroidota bacterium]
MTRTTFSVTRSVTVAVLLLLAVPASGQRTDEFAAGPSFSGRPLDVSSLVDGSTDHRLLLRLNLSESSFLEGWLGTGDRSAYPVIFGSVPAWWLASATLDEVSADQALRYTMAWVGTTGATILGKR